jgi:hypothetical protein
MFAVVASNAEATTQNKRPHKLNQETQFLTNLMLNDEK